MKKLVLFVAVAAIVSLSACKKTVSNETVPSETITVTQEENVTAPVEEPTEVSSDSIVTPPAEAEQ
jgi:uncharacterized lipoprotein YbaY